MFGKDREQVKVLAAKVLFEAREKFCHLLFGNRLDPGKNVA